MLLRSCGISVLRFTQICRSDEHTFYRSVHTFCRSDAHFLYVGCTTFVGRMHNFVGGVPTFVGRMNSFVGQMHNFCRSDAQLL